MALTFTTALAAMPATSTTPQDRSRVADQRRSDQGNQQDHRRFDDHDRTAVRGWYNQHQRNLPLGFRNGDRLPNRWDGQLREGWVIDRSLRGQAHSLPAALLRLLAPAPRGFRYIALDGNIVLIDGGYRVYDVMPIGHWG
jgi:Ni/Co efflux regulator RcnB